MLRAVVRTMSILTPPDDVLGDDAHGINQAHPSGRPHDTAAASVLLPSNAAIFFAASSHQYSTSSVVVPSRSAQNSICSRKTFSSSATVGNHMLPLVESLQRNE